MFRPTKSPRRCSDTGRISVRPRVETMEARLLLSSFTVLNVNDSGPDSLRQAILNANAAAGADTIGFNIPGAGVHTIAPISALPTLTDPVVIDGYTQPGASVNTLSVGDNAVLLIELNGESVSGAAIGLDLAGGNSTVRGLVINRFGANFNAFLGSAGIQIESDNNVLAGNFIGSNAAGTAAQEGDLLGVNINSGADNLIGGTTPAERNVFAGDATQNSASGGEGLNITTDKPGTRVQGNYFGMNAAGNAALGLGRGINVIGSASADITIGGLTSTPGTGAGNVISGNSSNGGIDGDGIFIASRPGGLVIQGNLIGLSADGTTAIPNGVSGINLVNITTGTGALLIGGTDAGARNVIFNNRITGIVSNADGLTVQGNYIGTDITGTFKPVPSDSRLNGGDAISLGGSATIGGDSAAARNVISAHGTGLHIFGGSVAVQGNFIGTTADGVTPLGNDGVGVLVENDAVVTLGGAAPGQGNVIADSFLAGVVIKNTAHVTILGNSIVDNGTRDASTNGHLGIDLNDDSVTPDDNNDPDTGPNNLQNFPVITSVSSAGGSTTIAGTFNSTPSTNGFRLEFFANTQADPSGFGEGQTFLGFTTVNTDAGGNATFSVTLEVAVPDGQVVTATATDPSGNTSEFSRVLQVAGTAPDLEISIAGDISVSLGQDVTDVVNITNVGTATATGLTLTDPMPTGASFVSATLFATVVNGVVTYTTATLSSTVVNGVLTVTNLGDLAPNDSIVLKIVLRPSVGGTLLDSVTVTAAETDPTPDNNTAGWGTRVIGPLLDGTLTGTAPDMVTLGQDVTYTLTATYTGSESDAGGSLTDTLPTNATFVSATGNPTLTNGVLTFALGGSLNSPDAFSFTIVVHPTAAGSLLNVAKVEFTGDSGAVEKSLNQNTVVTTTTAPSVDLVAGVSATPSPVTVGENLTYTVVITNTSETAATGVTLTNQLPANVAFISASRGSFDAASGSLTASLGAIAGGGSTTVTIVVRPVAAGSLTNVVNVAGDQADPNVGNNTVSNTATAVAVAPVENGPQVVSLQRYGYHMQPTLLVLTFDKALDPVNALQKTNYRIVDPGRDGRFGTRDDRVIRVKSAALDSSGRIVVLTPAERLPLNRAFRLTINGSGSHSVTDTAGRLLDGDHNGVAGGAFAARIHRGLLAGPASAIRAFAINNNSGRAAKRRNS
jgi:uncharacterized repeat protein (TIGR01451 family)